MHQILLTLHFSSLTDNSEAPGPGETGRVREAAEDGGQAEGAAQRHADEDGRLLRAAEVPQGRLHHQAERERRLLLRHSRGKSQDHQGKDKSLGIFVEIF